LSTSSTRTCTWFYASALWGLLPLVARRELQLEANGYGLLVSCVGAAAVIGSFLLRGFRRRWPTNLLLIAAIVTVAAMLLTLARMRWVPFVGVMLGPGAAAWTSSNQNFQIAVQMSAPGWVRASAIAAYQPTFQGGLALGSAIWGVVAERTDDVLTLAALGLVVGLVAALRWSVEDHK
jgi:predicted MFS family arabinose efflux permease